MGRKKSTADKEKRQQHIRETFKCNRSVWSGLARGAKKRQWRPRKTNEYFELEKRGEKNAGDRCGPKRRRLAYVKKIK